MLLVSNAGGSVHLALAVFLSLRCFSVMRSKQNSILDMEIGKLMLILNSFLIPSVPGACFGSSSCLPFHVSTLS